MEMVSRTAVVLQGLLTTVAEEVGQSCGLIQRQREFTASSWMATFVLGFLRHPRPRWDQLAWVARERGADVTGQAVEQRVTPALRDTLLGFWQKAIAEVVRADDRAQPLLERFTRVLNGEIILPARRSR